MAALFLAAALLGIASGVIFTYTGDLPKISALDNYNPGTTTRVLGRDGSVIGEFATERRDLVTYDQIPAVLRNAILAAEDASFFSHGGINLRRTAVAFVDDVMHMRYASGASTITMQLARKLFLTDEKGMERKIKEELLALQIEKRYTKEEIFTMYCNKIFWGHGAYGVEAASELYFAKHVSDLNLDEAALLAGIIQGNTRESPYVNPKLALQRRNYTLDQMARDGYITSAQAEAAEARPVVTHGQPYPPRSSAPYFVEEVRQQLEDKFSKEAVWQGGLTVKTGLDPVLQDAANKALDRQLRVLDKARGFRKPDHNVLTEGKTIDTYRNPRWTRDPAAGDIIPAVVLGVEKGGIVVSAGKWTGMIDHTGYSWTNRRADLLVKRGDLVEVHVAKVDPKAVTFTASLDQTPQLEGAVVALSRSFSRSPLA